MQLDEANLYVKIIKNSSEIRFPLINPSQIDKAIKVAIFVGNVKVLKYLIEYVIETPDFFTEKIEEYINLAENVASDNTKQYLREIHSRLTL